MNHPRAQQIRLPFSVPRPKKGQHPQVRVCGICQAKDSKYACPRCNVPYCSLNCFRSQAHVQCSEGFYRETILADVASDPSQGLEERKRMMDILQRLQDGQEDDEDLMRQLAAAGDEQEGGADELVEKMQDVDIDEIDSNDLFRLLPQEHRDRFLAMLRNPESDEARALVSMASGPGDGSGSGSAIGSGQEPGPLIGSAARGEDVMSELPWFAEPEELVDGSDPPGLPASSSPEVSRLESDGGGTLDRESQQIRRAAVPAPIGQAVLSAVKVPEGTGFKLRYNAVAISLAYIYILTAEHLPSLSPSHLPASSSASTVVFDAFSQLVPFLTSLQSTTRYETLRSAYSSFWDAVALLPHPSHPGVESNLATIPAANSPSPRLLINTLETLLPLLHPPLETDRPVGVLSVLSDMYACYERKKAGGAVGRKLAFYVVALAQMTRVEWLELEREVRREIYELREENGIEEGEGGVGGGSAERTNFLP